MKINIFTYCYKPEQFLINELCETLVKKGHQVQVFTGLPNYPKGDFFPGYSFWMGPFRENISGVEVIRYSIIPRKTGFKFRILNYFSHLFFGILNLFRLQKADVHFVFGLSPITIAIPAIILAKMRGVNTCLWLQDLWPESISAVGALREESALYRIVGLIVRWIYARLDLIMMQSPAFKENLDQFGYRGQSEYIPNWAPDLESPEGKPLPSWLKDFPEGFTVTFAGNVGIAQGINTILQAALALKGDTQIKFIVVGDGSSLESAQQFVIDNNLKNVFFFGHHPWSDMPALFFLSSCLLVSLKKEPIFEKTIPTKIQAYLAAGKPILASLDGVGSQVISESGSGLASSAEDVFGLVHNIRQMKGMTLTELKKYGDCAYSQFYQYFRKDRIIDQIEKSLECLK